MTEEIKKEIKNTFYIDEDNTHFEVAEININTLFKILDKYKDKEDKYKNAWEELFNTFSLQSDDKLYLLIKEAMQELEQKNGIGVE